MIFFFFLWENADNRPSANIAVLYGKLKRISVRSDLNENCDYFVFVHLPYLVRSLKAQTSPVTLHWANTTWIAFAGSVCEAEYWFTQDTIFLLFKFLVVGATQITFQVFFASCLENRHVITMEEHIFFPFKLAALLQSNFISHFESRCDCNNIGISQKHQSPSLPWPLSQPVQALFKQLVEKPI